MNHLRFLKYIDEIARSGSISKAAERLHVAASAVNRRLLDVEEEIGTPLFERLPRGMRLTAAGELFIGYVRSRNTELEQVLSQIEELKGLRRGTVRVVASQAVAATFLPREVALFRLAHPEVAFEVHVGDHLHALATLRAYESDLALVFNLAPEPDVRRIAVAEQKLLALMHRSHPLATQKEGLRLRDCAEYPLALPDQNTAGRQLLERFLVRSSVKLKPVIESNSFEFLRNCLYDRQSISFQVSIGAVFNHGELVSREIEDRGFPKGSLVLASLAGRHLPVITHAFVVQLEEAFTSQANG
jgi:DNA-binding transcriptional LysR family regulator